MKKNILIIALIAALAAVIFFWARKSTSLSITREQIDTTPARLEKVREIGEWEFLSVYDEELVDTTAVIKRIWPLPDGRKQLVRIYSGTLRLGFDLHRDTTAGWLEAHGDTVSVTLPPIRLLDERFVDEASARSVIEEGTWTHADRSALYRKAVRKMKRETLTDDNLAHARENARAQMETLLRAIGFTHITIE